MKKYKGKPMYYQRAPYNYEEYKRIGEEEVTKKNKVVAWEMCDGGNGRCKCPGRCIWAVVKRTKKEAKKLLKEKHDQLVAKLDDCYKRMGGFNMIKRLLKRFTDFLDYDATFHEKNGLIWHITSNKGTICIDIESLVNTKEFKRQLAAVKRLEQESHNV